MNMERLSEVLYSLGFDVQLSGSRKYVMDKFENLSSEQLAMLKEAFIKKNGHPRLRKGFIPHQSYGRKADCVEGVKNADDENGKINQNCGSTSSGKSLCVLAELTFWILVKYSSISHVQCVLMLYLPTFS